MRVFSVVVVVIAVVCGGCFTADVGADAVIFCVDSADCPAARVCIADRCVDVSAAAGDVCGDGIVAADGGEGCDDGDDNADDNACTAGCSVNVCGDGFVFAGVEDCDDGGLVSGDGCRADCGKLEICGDGVVDEGEVCDDGNVASADGCRADCGKVERCGDAIVDDGEACDDGDLDNGDACLVGCIDNVCGDGEVEVGVEACDGADVGVACTDLCEPESCAQATAFDLAAGEGLDLQTTPVDGVFLHPGAVAGALPCIGPGPESVLALRAVGDIRVNAGLTGFGAVGPGESLVLYRDVCGLGFTRCVRPDFAGLSGFPANLSITFDVKDGERVFVVADSSDFYLGDPADASVQFQIVASELPELPFTCTDPLSLDAAPTATTPVVLTLTGDEGFGSELSLCGNVYTTLVRTFVATSAGRLELRSADGPASEGVFDSVVALVKDGCDGGGMVCGESDTAFGASVAVDVEVADRWFVLVGGPLVNPGDRQDLTLTLTP